MTERLPRLRALMLAAALPLLSGCGSVSPGELESVAARWFDAIHARDYRALAQVDFTAPTERPDADAAEPGGPFGEWSGRVAGLLERYERQRETGSFELDPHGIVLVYATRLGRGTFYQVSRRTGTARRPELIVRLNFGYGEIAYGSLPPGTRVYLLGHPIGTIYSIELGRYERHHLDILEHAEVLIRFGRPAAPVAGDAPLKVESAAVQAGTTVHAEVEWIF